MEFINSHLISVLVFLPLLFGTVLLLVPDNNAASENILKGLGLGFSLIVFIISCVMYAKFDSVQTGFQLTENLPWIEAFGIQYAVGVDGISLLLIMLTTFLTPIVILGSWTAVESKLKTFLTK